MAAIIRVKRRNNVEPLDALLIACKKPKVNDDESCDSIPLTAVVKFAATVKNQDENVIEHVKQHINKEDFVSNYKSHKIDILKRMREDVKEHSRESRYKIINCHRALGEATDDDQDVTTVIDIEDSQVTNKTNKDEDNYVYDLYYTKAGNEMPLNELISIYPVESELVFENDNNSEDDDEDIYKTDDENSESNWRNDYPDESDENSVDEDDMRLAVENLKVDDELSSDEDFAYGLNEDDVNNYGYSYAKYKAKIKKELGEDSGSNASENSYDDYYDSDDRPLDCDDDND